MIGFRTVPTESPDRSSMSIETMMARAIIVTGTHYSMTSAVGALIGEARAVQVVHEPFNPLPTLGYQTIGTQRWYQHVPVSQLSTVVESLARIATGQLSAADIINRISRIRSAHDALRVAKVVKTSTVRKINPGRAVFKDPFMAFAARPLQTHYDTSVVVCVRHPCAFADSLINRTAGFDLGELIAQPDLLNELDVADRDLVERAHRDQWAPLDTAAVLWRVVYRFAATHLTTSPHTHVVRQDDLYTDAPKVIADLHSSLGLSCRRSPSDLATEYTTSERSVVGRRSHVHRNAAGASTRWRRSLTYEQQQRVRHITGSVAAQFGYPEWA